MTPEEKKTYRKLGRQCLEALDKLFDKQNGTRLLKASPNLYNNRLKRMHAFCIEHNLTKSSWLKSKLINP